MSAYEEEAERQVSQELRKMREDAQTFVDNMLEDAKHRAAHIISEGNATAEMIRQEAQQKAEEEREQLLTQAQKEGEELRELARQEGYAQAEAEANARIEREKQQFQLLIDDANAQRDAMIDALEDGIRGLVMEIAKKVIHVKLEESDAVFCGLVKDMIAEFHAADDLTVRICPSDYIAYFGPAWKPEGRRQDDGRVTLISDEEMKPGDCRIESVNAVIDCSLEKQLGVVENALYSE